MKTRTSFFAGLLFLILASNQEGCQKWQQLADKVKDTDADGWMDGATNQKVDFFIDAIDFNIGPGPVTLIVDDQMVPLNANVPPANFALTSRCAGQWHVGKLLNYSARVKFFTNGDTETATVRQFPFNNRDSSYQISFNLGGNNSVAFLYRTTVSSFADPSPADAHADADDDGVTDREEAELARGNFRLGDPYRKDIVVCIGYTSPKWAMTKKAIERITTVFLGRNFNMLLADEQSDLPGLTPGQIVFEDGGGLVIPAENRGVRLNEVSPLRPRHIAAALDSFTHMLVAADNTNTPGADFGIASLPGRNLVIRSHFFQLGPDPFGLEYQAKDAMHELGHNFGLCHPNRSDGTCPTGAIPVAERNGAASCMGSPADDGGLFNSGIPNLTAINNAFSRPLDYSPTQWANIDVASSRNR